MVMFLQPFQCQELQMVTFLFKLAQALAFTSQQLKFGHSLTVSVKQMKVPPNAHQ
jgi:hypothetical protein